MTDWWTPRGKLRSTAWTKPAGKWAGGCSGCVAVSAQVTVYAILPGRGYEQSVKILGAQY